MKKIIFGLVFIVSLFAFVSCGLGTGGSGNGNGNGNGTGGNNGGGNGSGDDGEKTEKVKAVFGDDFKADLYCILEDDSELLVYGDMLKGKGAFLRTDYKYRLDFKSLPFSSSDTSLWDGNINLLWGRQPNMCDLLFEKLTVSSALSKGVLSYKNNTLSFNIDLSDVLDIGCTGYTDGYYSIELYWDNDTVYKFYFSPNMIVTSDGYCTDYQTNFDYPSAFNYFVLRGSGNELYSFIYVSDYVKVEGERQIKPSYYVPFNSTNQRVKLNDESKYQDLISDENVYPLLVSSNITKIGNAVDRDDGFMCSRFGSLVFVSFNEDGTFTLKSDYILLSNETDYDSSIYYPDKNKKNQIKNCPGKYAPLIPTVYHDSFMGTNYYFSREDFMDFLERY